MDPTRCYLLILEHLETLDYAEARTYAGILHNLLEKRGFYPEGYQPERVDAVLEELLKPACAPSAIRVTFRSLTCYDCDVGQDIVSLQQAIDDGWTELVGHESLTAISHRGICPACRMQQSQKWLT